MSSKAHENFCQSPVNAYPFYSPRFWAGMRFGDYLGLLARNRFRIHPVRIPMTLLVGGCAMTTSCLSFMQQWVFNRKIESTEIGQPPIFVVGHWRSGTTLLHEMICLDPRFAWPNTFECFVPNHHLLSEPLLKPLVRLLMPTKRPMDAMPAGPALPQEDEFALIGMGAATPYYRLAFCNEKPPFVEMLNLKNASSTDIQKIRNSLSWFYRSLTYKHQKQLVLKSPTHTGRIGYLAEWFPGAKFIHITRHPYRVFPSTVHLWKTLAWVQGYQLPKDDDQEVIQYVNDCYREMYGGYFDQVEQIPDENLIHVRFEDLVDDPIAELDRIYASFDLANFDQLRPRLESFWKQRRAHSVNKTRLDDSLQKLIDEVWNDYMENFGYSLRESVKLHS